jgi:hypothetical protein
LHVFPAPDRFAGRVVGAMFAVMKNGGPIGGKFGMNLPSRKTVASWVIE